MKELNLTPNSIKYSLEKIITGSGEEEEEKD